LGGCWGLRGRLVCVFMVCAWLGGPGFCRLLGREGRIGMEFEPQFLCRINPVCANTYAEFVVDFCPQMG
jgi:hypothetical protein